MKVLNVSNVVNVVWQLIMLIFVMKILNYGEALADMI